MAVYPLLFLFLHRPARLGMFWENLGENRETSYQFYVSRNDNYKKCLTNQFTRPLMRRVISGVGAACGVANVALPLSVQCPGCRRQGSANQAI